MQSVHSTRLAEPTLPSQQASKPTGYPHYAEYKNSGVPWLGEIPSHWEVSRLKNSILSLKNGVWGSDAKGNENDITCIRVADFDRRRFIIQKKQLTIRNIESKDYLVKKVSKGDLLLEKSGGGEKQPVGCVVYNNLETKAVCSNFVARIIMAESMDAKFWTYFHGLLYSARVNIRSIKQSTGIQNLDSDSYLNELACYPPLTEQQAIVDFLDSKLEHIDRLISKQQQLLDKLAEQRTAVISHAVTKGLTPNAPMKDSDVEWLGEVPESWETTKVKFVTTKVGSGKTPKGGAEIYQQSGIALLRSQNIHFTGIAFDDVVYISQNIHDEMRNSQVMYGDVLLNITGGSLGRCSFVEVKDEMNVNQHVCIVRPNHLISTKYMHYFLTSNFGQEQIWFYQQGGGREGLNFQDLKCFDLFLPQDYEQQAIVDYLDQETARIDDITKTTKDIISKLQEYRSALITQAVTGKIDVTAMANQTQEK